MKAGAEAIFPPGTVIAEAAEKLLKNNKRPGIEGPRVKQVGLVLRLADGVTQILTLA